MRSRRGYLAAAAIAVTLVSGSALAAKRAYWRPVMPSVTVDIRTDDRGEITPSLMLFYWEKGADPLRTGTLAPGWRLAQCQTNGSLCIAAPARNEWHAEPSRRQSLQIRLFNGNGNPIVGGVNWTGPAYPKQVRIVCDLRVSDPERTCVLDNQTV